MRLEKKYLAPNVYMSRKTFRRLVKANLRFEILIGLECNYKRSGVSNETLADDQVRFGPLVNQFEELSRKDYCAASIKFMNTVTGIDPRVCSKAIHKICGTSCVWVFANDRLNRREYGKEGTR